MLRRLVVDELPLDQNVIDAGDERVGSRVLAAHHRGLRMVVDRSLGLRAQRPERDRQSQRRSDRDAGRELDRMQFKQDRYPA